MKECIKPEVELTGQDGNIFNLVAIATRALKKVKQHENSKKLTKEVFNSHSYEEALSIIEKYCDVY